MWLLVVVATAGVIAGTALGTRILGDIPERTFRRVVALLLLALGVWMVAAGVR